MAKVKGKNVTIIRDVLPSEADDYSEKNPKVVVQYDDGHTEFVDRKAVSDHDWSKSSVKPPPVDPAYRNPHHPADHIPEDPDPNWKNPNARDLKEHPGETPEQTRERHRNNPNRNPNDPIDPVEQQKILDQRRRDERDNLIAEGKDPDKGTDGRKDAYDAKSPAYTSGPGGTEAVRQAEVAKADADAAAAKLKAAQKAEASDNTLPKKPWADTKGFAGAGTYPDKKKP